MRLQADRSGLRTSPGRGIVLTVLLLAGVVGCSGSEDLPPPPEERPPAEGTANDAVATFPPPEEDLDLPVTTDG